jgi:hypothetical protein
MLDWYHYIREIPVVAREKSKTSFIHIGVWDFGRLTEEGSKKYVP